MSDPQVLTPLSSPEPPRGGGSEGGERGLQLSK